jgi:hypothetical protein
LHIVSQDKRQAFKQRKADPVFQAFQEMAQDQSWLEVASFRHAHHTEKKRELGDEEWPFGWSHSKELATLAGCRESTGTYSGTEEPEEIDENREQGIRFSIVRDWEHCCIVVWRKSDDGSELRSQHTVFDTEPGERKTCYC